MYTFFEQFNKLYINFVTLLQKQKELQKMLKRCLKYKLPLKLHRNNDNLKQLNGNNAYNKALHAKSLTD